jgi:hypothetical protein
MTVQDTVTEGERVLAGRWSTSQDAGPGSDRAVGLPDPVRQDSSCQAPYFSSRVFITLTARSQVFSDGRRNLIPK